MHTSVALAAPHRIDPRTAAPPDGVLAGTDGSECAGRALAWAGRIADLAATPLHVFHPNAIPVDEPPGARVRLSASGPDACETLTAAATADTLVVVGPRGGSHGDGNGIGLGHTALRLAVGAPTVAVVGGLDPAVHGEHGVITAALRGGADHAVLRWAAALALRTGSRLALLHVGTDRGLLDRAAAEVDGLGVPTTPVLTAPPAPGHVHEVLACLRRTDLLVLGRGRRPGLLGASTLAALHHAPCPVLVAKT